MKIGTLAGMAAAMTVLALNNEEPPHRAKPVQRRQEPEFRRVYRKNPRLNRSRHWPTAETYADARAMSPFPNRPVR